MSVALITGITGQDGSYLAERLVDGGWTVHGLVRDGVGMHESAPAAAVTVHRGDLADLDGLGRLVRAVRPDVVFNLAGVSSVAYSWKHPVDTALLTGVAPTALLKACWQLQQDEGVPVRFIQASSSEIFGKVGTERQDEQTPIRPVTPYGAAKAFAHHQVAVYRGRGLFAANAILYNHESPRRPPTFVTRKITMGVAAIVQGREQGITLGNLDAERDWGWAPDYVDAMLRMASAVEARDYIVATGETRSVRDFARSAFAAAGIDDMEGYVTLDPHFARPSDAPVMRGDSTKLRTELGWAPTRSFESIVSAMIEHDLARLPE